MHKDSLSPFNTKCCNNSRLRLQNYHRENVIAEEEIYKRYYLWFSVVHNGTANHCLISSRLPTTNAQGKMKMALIKKANFSLEIANWAAFFQIIFWVKCKVIKMLNSGWFQIYLLKTRINDEVDVHCTTYNLSIV